jgi:hypothetical protein
MIHDYARIIDRKDVVIRHKNKTNLLIIIFYEKKKHKIYSRSIFVFTLNIIRPKKNIIFIDNDQHTIKLCSLFLPKEKKKKDEQNWRIRMKGVSPDHVYIYILHLPFLLFFLIRGHLYLYIFSA